MPTNEAPICVPWASHSEISLVSPAVSPSCLANFSKSTPAAAAAASVGRRFVLLVLPLNHRHVVGTALAAVLFHFQAQTFKNLGDLLPGQIPADAVLDGFRQAGLGLRRLGLAGTG